MPSRRSCGRIRLAALLMSHVRVLAHGLLRVAVDCTGRGVRTGDRGRRARPAPAAAAHEPPCRLRSGSAHALVSEVDSRHARALRSGGHGGRPETDDGRRQGHPLAPRPGGTVSPELRRTGRQPHDPRSARHHLQRAGRRCQRAPELWKQLGGHHQLADLPALSRGADRAGDPRSPRAAAAGPMEVRHGFEAECGRRRD